LTSVCEYDTDWSAVVERIGPKFRSEGNLTLHFISSFADVGHAFQYGSVNVLCYCKPVHHKQRYWLRSLRLAGMQHRRGIKKLCTVRVGSGMERDNLENLDVDARWC
jgi:hypothetical protein